MRRFRRHPSETAMRFRFPIFLIIAATLPALVSVHASAQTCLGGIPKEDRLSVHLGGTLAGARSPEAFVGATGRLSFGYRLAFGGAEIFRSQGLSINSDSVGLGLFGGVRLRLGNFGEVCPQAHYNRSITETRVSLTGPVIEGLPLDDIVFEDLTVSKSASVAVGVPILKRGRVSFVPTASFELVGASSKIVRSSIPFFSDERSSIEAATLQAGCGIVVGRRIAFIVGISKAVWSSAEMDLSTNLFGSLVLNLKK